MTRVADITANILLWIMLTVWIGSCLLELLRGDWDVTEIPWTRAALAFGVAGGAAALFLREVFGRDG